MQECLGACVCDPQHFSPSHICKPYGQAKFNPINHTGQVSEVKLAMYGKSLWPTSQSALQLPFMTQLLQENTQPCTVARKEAFYFCCTLTSISLIHSQKRIQTCISLQCQLRVFPSLNSAGLAGMLWATRSSVTLKEASVDVRLRGGLPAMTSNSCANTLPAYKSQTSANGFLLPHLNSVADIQTVNGS